jgi:hypothetical protein
MKPDFYAVQGWMDKFKLDIITFAIFQTEPEAKAYCDGYRKKYPDEEVVIVPQNWGEYDEMICYKVN